MHMVTEARGYCQSDSDFCLPSLFHPIHNSMSTSDQPIPKRKRTEHSQADLTPRPSAAPVVRSDVWYEDGNVVLQAENTQFKVFRGVLAEASTVFKDMFSFPQPSSSGQELVEGCPVVFLTDSAEEVRYMLRALCQRECVLAQSQGSRHSHFDVVADMHPTIRAYRSLSYPHSFLLVESTTFESYRRTRGTDSMQSFL